MLTNKNSVCVTTNMGYNNRIKIKKKKVFSNWKIKKFVLLMFDD